MTASRISPGFRLVLDRAAYTFQNNFTDAPIGDSYNVAVTTFANTRCYGAATKARQASSRIRREAAIRQRHQATKLTCQYPYG
jgi:hypothetical protein